MRPATAAGARLIAHELAHTVQQRGAGPWADRFAGSAAAEHEATQAAGTATVGRPAPITLAAAGVQCQPAQGDTAAQPQRPAPAIPRHGRRPSRRSPATIRKSILSKDPNNILDRGKEYGGLIC